MPSAPRPPEPLLVCLPIYCRGCGRPLSVAYLPGRWRADKREWHCPFGSCDAVAIIPFDVYGRIVEIRPGH